MPTLNMAAPDVLVFQPALVVQLRDAFTEDNILAGDVTVQIAQTQAMVPNPPSADFVFTQLGNGTYAVNVRSTPDEPYYVPTDIVITLPFPRPATSLWPQPPVWTGYPDLVLADPTKLLDDPEQPPAYLAQREQTALLPTTAYPFPAGSTLVRGTITAAGAPLSGAMVTNDLVAQAGQLPVVVVNTAGLPTAAVNLTVVNTPVINSLEPGTVIAGSANFALNVSGSGFDSGAVVKLNGTPLPTTVLSAAFVTAQVNAAQAAAAGKQTVVIANPDGTVSNQQTLTVATAPVIASINPASITAGSGAFTLTVQGSGFSPSSGIKLKGAAIATTFVSSTVLSGMVTAAQIAAAGPLSVIVTPGGAGQNSSAATLSVVSVPVVTSLEPATVIAGTPAFTLTLQGSGFVAGTTVSVNGSAATTTFVNATQVVAQITAAQIANAGQLSVVAANPDKTASTAQTLTVAAAPAISTLEPATITADSAAFTITIVGTGFMPGAVVQLNGIALQTTFVSSGQVYAIVPRSGYTTSADGTFVLFFNDIPVSSQVETLMVTHPSYPTPKLLDVTVLRGATVSVSIDMSS